MKAKSRSDAQPWWRHGMVWLVISGPLIVVVASLASAVVAVRGADPVVSQPSDQEYQRPAVQGRNHAATAGGSALKP
ncbi:MAG: nitrogen fixation protein FixH [Betaproteobacteria bacterium]|jgi:uncharacterized protein|nr:nitrogen fixation protein FixH [Betaproteobacteria bacterium]